MLDLKKHFGNVVVKITVSNDEIERLSKEELADLIEWRFYKTINELLKRKRG